MPAARPALAAFQARRQLLAGGLGLLVGCGLLAPRQARAMAAGLSFDAVSIPDALRAMGAGAAGPERLVLVAPDVAEDGALVPVSVDSRLAGTREIYLVVDVNPAPVAARFSLPAGTEAYVATRIKVASDGVLYAVVKDDRGGVHVASRTLKVTVGGCA